MKRNKILATVAILLFIGLLIIVGVCLQKLNTQNVEEHNFYQYFAGQKFSYEGGLNLSRKDGISELIFKDTKVELDSTPVYYEDISNKVLFPEDMAIVFPNQSGLMYKIKRFSNIIFDTETAYLEKNNENRALNHAFLFDGQDLYFFLERTKLNTNGQEYELSPLSYVICSEESLEFYQKEEDKYTIFDIKPDEILAYTQDYKINLNTDSIQGKEKEQLLIKNKQVLRNF